jgi:alkyl hydroperoxide reductase subunit AhpF
LCVCLSTKGVNISQEPPKREGDVVQRIGVIQTPLLSIENVLSVSRQCNDVVLCLDFMIEFVLHNSFSWVFTSLILVHEHFFHTSNGLLFIMSF